MQSKTLLLALLNIAALVAAIPAYGQTGRVKIKVPFNFAMGEKMYQAGEYSFSSLQDTVILRNSDGTRIAIALANHTPENFPGKTGKVLFDGYVDRCFVSKIWISGQDQGRELLRSRLESKVVDKQSERSIALLGIGAQ